MSAEAKRLFHVSEGSEGGLQDSQTTPPVSTKLPRSGTVTVDNGWEGYSVIGMPVKSVCRILIATQSSHRVDVCGSPCRQKTSYCCANQKKQRN